MIFFKAACSSHPWQYRACIFFVLSKTRDNFPRDENTSVGCSVFAGLERSASQGRSYYWFSLKKRALSQKPFRYWRISIQKISILLWWRRISSWIQNPRHFSPTHLPDWANHLNCSKTTKQKWTTLWLDFAADCVRAPRLQIQEKIVVTIDWIGYRCWTFSWLFSLLSSHLRTRWYKSVNSTRHVQKRGQRDQKEGDIFGW